MSNENISVHRFSECAAEDCPTLKKEPVEFLRHVYGGRFSFGLDNLKEQGVYKWMGWAFNFRPFLKKFVYKQNGTWHEAFAPNKTALRGSTYGRIDKIMLIPPTE